MPAELGAHRFRDLAHGGVVHGLLELGHHLARAGPAQFAALCSRAYVLGKFPGQSAEILVRQGAGAQAGHQVPGLLIGEDLRGLDQDVARLGLVDNLLAAALVLHVDQVKAAVAADGVGGGALGHVRRHVGKQRG